MPSATTSLGEKLLGALDAVYGFFTHPDVGSIASVIGAVLSFWVLLSVSDIRRRVLLKLRAPDAIKELTERASTISNAMQDFDASLPRIDESIELANETLKNVSRKVSGDVKATIKSTMKAIDAYRALQPTAKSRDSVRVVYVQLLVSVKAIENLVADFREEP
jgi:hypothetical protein